MKKFLALLLAVALMASVALADAVKLEGTALSLTWDDAVEYELEAEDIEDGIVAAFGNEDETLFFTVYVEEFDGTLADIEAEYAEGVEGLTIASTGYTNINGIDCFFSIESEDGENYIMYYVMDDANLVTIEIWYANDDAGALSGSVMATLAR